ncbi:MAG: HlyD family efflux transporter periplasmic adaptor subunit, partial [Clostridiaceae bacterium]
YKLNKEMAAANLKMAKARLNQLPDRASDDKEDELKGAVEAAEAQVKINQLQLDKCSIKALNSGVITTVYVNKGEIVSQGMNIAKVYDLKSEYVKVYIEESKRDKVELNKTLNIYVNDNKTIKGKISYISPESEFTPKNTETKEDKENTVFMIKLKIDESDKAYPGMMVDVELK